MKHYNIPIFVSHFGCPNDCVFCNQRKINGRETDITIRDIEDTIESYLKTLPKKSKKEVAFFGGTFTGISKGLQEEYLKVVNRYIVSGKIDGIRLSTRPDYIDEEIVKMLKRYKVTTIELGVQSFDEDVLKKSARYYPIETVEKASKLIQKYGIDLGIQIMIGLPKATDKSDFQTALKLVKLKPNLARIYPTLVIKETKLADMYKKGEYLPLTLEEAVRRCQKIYALLEREQVNIVRVGLQPTEELNDSENVIAGPFHPAFRELVVGEIYFNFLRSIYQNKKEITIEANQQNISRIIGINGRNKKRLETIFKIKIDNKLGKDKIRVSNKLYEWQEILEYTLKS